MSTFTTNRPFVAEHYTPQVRRPVKVRAIACPTCGAEVGQSCFEAGTGSHRARTRMATRAYLLERASN